jgi:nucleotide-binding universal stress UspA family protein
MLPVHTILFPTDLSERADQAFPLACSLARDCGARVVVLYVMPPPLGPELIEARHRPDEYRRGPRQALHRVQAPGDNVRVEHRLEEGNAAEVILEVARDLGAGLVVMGTHGRTGPGHLLFGSVAEAVLRKAPCPVLTVKAPPPATPGGGAAGARPGEGRPEGTILWPLRTILHPTDASACSREAFRLACSLARDHGARLIALRVTAVPDLVYEGYGTPGSPLAEEEYVAEARKDVGELRPADPGLALERRVEEGDPAAEILRVAAEAGADLIVMGTHGRTGLRHLLLGSVAEQVVRKAPCPVLTLTTPAG